MKPVKINRDALLACLQQAEPGLSKNERLEQSSCFVLRRGRVVTFNEDMCIRVPGPFPKDVTAAVQSRSFMGWLKKVPDPVLRMKFTDDHLHINGQGKGTKIRYTDRITLPVDSVEVPDKDDWNDLPPNFGEAIAIVSECTGKEKKKTALSCVHLTPGWVEAAEGFQATRYKIKLPFDRPFLAKPTALKHAVALDCNEIAVGGDWVHFRSPSGVVVSCRRHDQEFMDLTESLRMDDGVTAELPEGLDGAVERGEVFSKENETNYLVVAIEDGMLTVTAVGMTGKCWEDHNVKYAGDPIAFLIAPNMLAEVVKRSSKVKIGDGKLKVRGPNWCYVTSLTDPKTAIHKAEETAGAGAEEEDA